MEKVIKYLRTPDRTPIGVMIGLEKGSVGIAMCNPKDAFNKELGKKIAEARTLEANKFRPPNRSDYTIDQFKEDYKRFTYRLNRARLKNK